MTHTDEYTRIFSEKQRILVVMAHPDDAEIYCGGTIARLRHDNKKVMVVKMTVGNKGSRQEKISEQELGELREREDAKAMEVLGVSKEYTACLKIGDGSVENDIPTIGLVAKQIRIFQPELIITHNPEDMIIRFDQDVNWVNHRDHRNTGKTAIDAAYPYSRDLLFFPEHFQDPKTESHAVSEFLLVDYYDHKDTVHIDMTAFAETRTKAIAAHQSQYPQKKAQDSTDFFTKLDDSGKRYERFRYVVAD
ncbi:MAG: PIG-L family deacetylase [Candidatus Pacebacteria bacterium]|nr:PIG-L family deacetylase [Candidatus Paceibacterota bacterium]